MEKVSKNLWPSLICHSIWHNVTTLYSLLVLEEKSGKLVVEPEGRTERQDQHHCSQVNGEFRECALQGSLAS